MNFIIRKKIVDVNDYCFVLVYKEIFEVYFCLLDFEFIIEWYEEVLYIKNILNFNYLRFRKVESILLLIIRMLY